MRVARKTVQKLLVMAAVYARSAKPRRKRVFLEKTLVSSCFRRVFRDFRPLMPMMLVRARRQRIVYRVSAVASCSFFSSAPCSFLFLNLFLFIPCIILLFLLFVLLISLLFVLLPFPFLLVSLLSFLSLFLFFLFFLFFFLLL